MRAVCNTDTFGKKLALVSRGVSARSTIQLLGGIFTLEHDDSEGTVRLVAGENEYRIRAYAADDYPQLPAFPEEGSSRMSGESLVETVEKVSRSYSRDETRPVLTGILISFEDSRVRMVTTDSYRLSIKETEL